jgi:hypothetical protein
MQNAEYKMQKSKFKDYSLSAYSAYSAVYPRSSRVIQIQPYNRRIRRRRRKRFRRNGLYLSHPSACSAYSAVN